MIGENLPYYSKSIPHDNEESFMTDFETIVLKLRRNIMLLDFFDVKHLIYMKFGRTYNHIHIIEVDLFADSSRSSDCIDQILKAIKDSLSDNDIIKSKFSELLIPNLREIHKDVIIDEIFQELMNVHEHVLVVVENFNYYTNHICDNDYFRLNNLCRKKYPNKLSFILVIDSEKKNSVESSYYQNFLLTFQLDDIEFLSAIPSNKIIYNIQLKKQKMNTPEIYISYAWTDESEDILKTLCTALEEKKIRYFVDKKNVEYRGNIRKFEERLGNGGYIILIVSDKFLKSKDCMYEVLQIMEKSESISQRIYPIVLSDAKIYDPEQRIDYIKYWEDKIDSLNAKLKTIGAQNLSGLRSEIDNYAKYRDIIDKIMTILKEMNNLSPDIHRDSKFKQLIDSLKEQQIDEKTEDITRNALPKMDSRYVNQFGSKSVYIEKNEGNITIN